MAKWVTGVLVLLLVLAAGEVAAEKADKPAAAGKPDKEAERIEEVVTGLLETHRAGSYDLMSRYYAPEVTMVSAAYEAPLVGWENVRKAYLAQEMSLQHFELMREGTSIERRGKLAWVSYRWTSVAKVRDQYLTTLGHTTLILEKRGGKWLIVYNHTSAAPPRPAPRPPAPSPDQR